MIFSSFPLLTPLIAIPYQKSYHLCYMKCVNHFNSFFVLIHLHLSAITIVSIAMLFLCRYAVITLSEGFIIPLTLHSLSDHITIVMWKYDSRFCFQIIQYIIVISEQSRFDKLYSYKSDRIGLPLWSFWIRH